MSAGRARDASWRCSSAFSGRGRGLAVSFLCFTSPSIPIVKAMLQKPSMHTSKYVVYVHDQSRLHVVENTRRTDERSKNGYPPGTKVRIRQHALDIHQMHTISDVGFLSCEMHRSFRDYSCVLASPTTLDRAGTPRPVEIRKLYKRWQDLIDEKQFRTRCRQLPVPLTVPARSLCKPRALPAVVVRVNTFDTMTVEITQSEMR